MSDLLDELLDEAVEPERKPAVVHPFDVHGWGWWKDVVKRAEQRAMQAADLDLKRWEERHAD